MAANVSGNRQGTTSVLELDEVLDEVRVQVGRLLDVSGLHVVLYDDKTRCCTLSCVMTAGKSRLNGSVPTSRQRLTDWVIRHQQSLLLRDYPNDPVPCGQPCAGMETRRSRNDQVLLGVPLIVRDKVIGAVFVQSYQPNCFGETDQQVLTTVASQVSTGLKTPAVFEFRGESENT